MAIAAADAIAATAAALTESTSLHDRRSDTLIVGARRHDRERRGCPWRDGRAEPDRASA
jgi:hypothetical protein